MKNKAFYVIFSIIFVATIGSNIFEIVRHNSNDATNQFMFDEKQAEIDKKYQNIMNTLDKIEKELDSIEKRKI